MDIWKNLTKDVSGFVGEVSNRVQQLQQAETQVPDGMD